MMDELDGDLVNSLIQMLMSQFSQFLTLQVTTVRNRLPSGAPPINPLLYRPSV